MLKIDMHSHLMPGNLPNWAGRFGYGGFIHLEHHRPGYARMMQGDKFFREIASNCWDPTVRMEEYMRGGVQVQVVSTIPVLFAYWAPPEHCLDVSMYLNDHLAEVVQKYPKNYIGLATLPMQDEELAIGELIRCKKELGLKGVQIGTNINDLNLNESTFFQIFKACSDLGMAVLVHPWNMLGKGLMDKYWLPWLVGMPAETARAACSMIFGGVLERLPQLRVNFSHASGSFLATIGRIEHGFNCRPDLVAVDNSISPTSYLGKFWVDSITHDERYLRYVLDLQGSKRVTFGTDYPFPLGDLELGRFIEEGNFSPEEKEDIFAEAALEWLDIKAADFL